MKSKRSLTIPLIASVALWTVPMTALSQNADGGRILPRMNFDASAANVFQALAKMANWQIVLSEDIKKKVTVILNNTPADQAFRQVAAQAGVAYRRIGTTVIVAPTDQMAKVMENYGVEERVPLTGVSTETAIKQLKEAVPFIGVRPAGRSVVLVGAPEDLTKAKTILSEIDTPEKEPTASAALTLTNAPAADIAQVLSTQFTTLKAQKVGETAIAFSGPRSEVERAKEFISLLDKGKEANSRWAVYPVKYSSARALAFVIRGAVRNLTVLAGPDPYHIPYTRPNLSTANTIGGTGVSGGGTSGGQGGVGNTGGGTGGGGGTGDSSQGNDTSSTGDTSSQGGRQGGQTGERSRTLLLGGTEENVKAALEILAQIDIPTPQVQLDVKVVSASPQATSNLGVEWSQSVGTTLFERPNLLSGDAGNDFPANNTGKATDILKNGFGLGSFGRLPITLTATLNAFFQRTDVRILAKPSTTALDNEDGVIFVGETRRVSVSNIVPGANNLILNQIVEIPVGIILQMRPRVNADGHITMHVHATYSSVGTANSNGLFSTFQREADTTVRVLTGETIVIGGLLQDEETKIFSKVPILGDLPLLGQFFRNSNKTRLRREVMVFVTPHLLKD